MKENIFKFMEAAHKIFLEKCICLINNVNNDFCLHFWDKEYNN